MRKLVFFAGAAGAGKTTLAEAVIRHRPAAYLDMDTLLRPAAIQLMTLLGEDPSDRDSPVYKAHCRDLGYRLTMDAALEQLRLGMDAYVIGPFTRETENADWLAQELGRIDATTNNVDVKVVLVYLSDMALYRERIKSRGSELDIWKLENWDRFSQSLAPRTLRWPLPDHAVLHFANDGPLTEEKLMHVVQFIDRNGATAVPAAD
jgi:hypothetical protein